jgi:Tfp pilus assembly protein PilO
MMKLSEREKWLLLATAVFLAFYFFFNLLYSPKAAENYKMGETLKAKKLELNTAQEKIKIFKSMELMPVKKTRAKGKEEVVVEALQYISREVSKLKLNMMSVRPRLEEKAVDSAKAVFMDLTFVGNYNTIYRFMSALEKLPILILVDSMDMTKSGSVDVKVNMVLSIYY